MIEKKSGVPYYLQLSDYLINLIRTGEIKPGEKIPSEMMLSDRFRVNRHTVRQAVAKLANLGWVTTVKGVGSFVRERPIIPYQLSDHTRFTEEIKRLGKAHQSKLLHWEKEMPTAKERELLQLTEADHVYRIEIIRYVEDIPYSVGTSILVEREVPCLERHLASFSSLYNILQEKYGFRPVRIRSTIRSTFCTLKEANFLPWDSPILEIESLMVKPGGNFVEISNMKVRGDMNELTIEFGNGR